MRRRHLCAGLLCCLAVRAEPALAWNGPGHEVVAQIAWDQMTPAQRTAAVDLLRPHPRFDKDLMQHLADGEDPAEHAFREAATWPDEVRKPNNPLSRTDSHPAWHYVDYPYDRDGKAGRPPVEQWDGQSDPANLLQAMQKMTAELRDGRTPADRRAIDLCWLLHLVGDVHQPMHAVSLFSNAYPNGDQGGNLLRVRTDYNPSTALHAVWDGIEGRSFDAAVIHQTAERIEQRYPRADLTTALDVTDPKAWAAESAAIARRSAYLDGKLVGLPKDQAAARPDDVPPLPIGYERQARDVADRQMAVAGYRLAEVLRPLLRPSPATGR